MAIQITCINKDNGNHENPYVAISHLGWKDQSGKVGRNTRLEIYDFIKSEGGQAYVLDPRDYSKAYLEALVSPAGTKYVRTKPNDTGRDNLLSLPEC